MRQLDYRAERWPLAAPFRIARGSRTHAEPIVVTIREDGFTGRGECLPYARYGETVDSVMAQIRAIELAIQQGLTRAELQTALAPGAARNALDCALWDLHAKQQNQPIWQLAELPSPTPLTTAFTLSIDTPELMAIAAQKRFYPLLKLKCAGDEQDGARISAVRQASPNSQLIVDANEAWDSALYEALLPQLIRDRVSLIEQPFPAQDDGALAALPRPIPVCADESCHTVADLADLAARYDAINLKLDKTGGLTAALALRQAARAANLQLMVGCMVATSLAMAPAFFLAQSAQFVDLDGPLLLAEDRPHAFAFVGSEMQLPTRALWG